MTVFAQLFLILTLLPAGAEVSEPPKKLLKQAGKTNEKALEVMRQLLEEIPSESKLSELEAAAIRTMAEPDKSYRARHDYVNQESASSFGVSEIAAENVNKQSQAAYASVRSAGGSHGYAMQAAGVAAGAAGYEASVNAWVARNRDRWQLEAEMKAWDKERRERLAAFVWNYTHGNWELAADETIIPPSLVAARAALRAAKVNPGFKDYTGKSWEQTAYFHHQLTLLAEVGRLGTLTAEHRDEFVKDTLALHERTWPSLASPSDKKERLSKLMSGLIRMFELPATPLNETIAKKIKTLHAQAQREDFDKDLFHSACAKAMDMRFDRAESPKAPACSKLKKELWPN